MWSGKLVLPLSSHFNEVVGVAIAEAILQETRKNIGERHPKAEVKLIQPKAFF